MKEKKYLTKKKKYKLVICPLFTIKKEIIEAEDEKDLEKKADEITLKNVEYVFEDITDEV